MKRCVREHSAATGNVRFLLYVLADLTATGEDNCYPSHRRIRLELGVMDARSVSRIVRRAQGIAELVVKPGIGGNPGRDKRANERGHLTRYYVRCGIGSDHVADEEPRKTVAGEPLLQPPANGGRGASVPTPPNGGQT